MARRKVYSVQKRSSKSGWKVKKKGGKVVAKTDTKAKAVKTATATASKDKRSSVVIHKADGKVQEERTYPRGSDPRKSKG